MDANLKNAVFAKARQFVDQINEHGSEASLQASRDILEHTRLWVEEDIDNMRGELGGSTMPSEDGDELRLVLDTNPEIVKLRTIRAWLLDAQRSVDEALASLRR